MNKTIFLICNSYPYFNGEAYLETEIDYLSKKFDKIILFSIVANKKKDSPTRTPPSNVEIVPLSSPKKHFLNTFKGLFLSDKLFRFNYKNIKEFLVYKYLLARNNEIFKKIVKYILRNKINTDYTIFYSYWLSFAPAIVKTAKLFKNNHNKTIKSISRAHGYDLYWERMPLNIAPLQKNAIELLDFVYCVSEKGREYLISKYPNCSQKIKLARLGTKDYGLSNKYNKDCHDSFATCSNNRPVKRLDLFAAAYSIYAKKNTHTIWHAIGLKGNEENIICNFKSTSSSPVKYYGFIRNKEIIDVYKQETIDYFVNVSSSEGLSVAIMEALSFGTPVIATDVGGNSELVDDSCGFLIPPNPSANELSEILEKAANVPFDKYINMRINARKKWEKIVNADKNYNDWMNTLETL